MQLDLIFDGRPVPNENGVYDDDDAYTLTMPRTKNGAMASVFVIEAAPGEWVHATSYMLNTMGRASPLHAGPRSPRFYCREDAIACGLVELATDMDSADRDCSSTAPSKTQIKQVRDWVKAQKSIYRALILEAA